ncbi:MAG: nucleoside hydrolase, partial [Gammaproteobacteria bacterium]|nr:nucleoside hydrolase [Gammaproteobacteria bacterium]
MKRLVVDTDPGVDDALAIMMACAHPDTKLHAITTVAGNVSLDYTSANACKLVEFLGLDTETPKGKDVVALAGYKRAIGNFVNIVTGENIPVSFNNNN